MHWLKIFPSENLMHKGQPNVALEMKWGKRVRYTAHAHIMLKKYTFSSFTGDQHPWRWKHSFWGRKSHTACKGGIAVLAGVWIRSNSWKDRYHIIWRNIMVIHRWWSHRPLWWVQIIFYVSAKKGLLKTKKDHGWFCKSDTKNAKYAKYCVLWSFFSQPAFFWISLLNTVHRGG